MEENLKGAPHAGGKKGTLPRDGVPRGRGGHELSVNTMNGGGEGGDRLKRARKNTGPIGNNSEKRGQPQAVLGRRVRAQRGHGAGEEPRKESPSSWEARTKKKRMCCSPTRRPTTRRTKKP